MNNTKQINSSYINSWRFIEEYLPNYYSHDDVLRNDILFRFFYNDDVCDEDLKWIQEEFQGKKELVAEELIRLESNFAAEAIKAYYTSIYLHKLLTKKCFIYE